MNDGSGTQVVGLGVWPQRPDRGHTLQPFERDVHGPARHVHARFVPNQRSNGHGIRLVAQAEYCQQHELLDFAEQGIVWNDNASLHGIITHDEDVG